MDGNPKIILALVWLIILNFFVAKLRSLQLKQEQVSCRSLEPMFAGQSADLFDSRALLAGLNSRFGLELVSLQHDFADGWQILRMVDALQSGSDSVVAKGHKFCSDHERLKFALNCAESRLGVRQLIDADDIRRERPEMRSLIIYLCKFLENDLERELVDECDLIRLFVNKASASLANNNGLAELKYEYVELRPIYERLSRRLDGDCAARWTAIENEFRREKELFKLKLKRTHRDAVRSEKHLRLAGLSNKRSDSSTLDLSLDKLAGLKPSVRSTGTNRPDRTLGTVCSRLHWKLLQAGFLSGRTYLESVTNRRLSTVCRLTGLISFSLYLFVLLPLFTNRIYFCRC